MRCHSTSLCWGAVIYYICSQAASSTSTPVNDFLHQSTIPPCNHSDKFYIFSGRLYCMCRWRQRNSEGGGQAPPVEKKWVMSITQNTSCLVAELLSCLREMQMRKIISLPVVWWMFTGTLVDLRMYSLGIKLCIQRKISILFSFSFLFFNNECFRYCVAVWGFDFTLKL